MGTSISPHRSQSGAQTLLNGLHVIQAVAAGSRSQVEVQEALGLPRSTAHRLVSTLRAEHFLRDSELGLALGPALISLGFAALAENQLADVAQPILLELAEQVHDTVHMAVEEESSVLYLSKISAVRGPETRSRVGLRMPLTRTGIGKALMLDQPEMWERQYKTDSPVALSEQGSSDAPKEFADRMAVYQDFGFTLDIEENEPGVRCVAAPIRGPRGEISGAISVTATTPYMSSARMRALVPTVFEYVDRIGYAIGGVETDKPSTLQELECDERFNALFNFD